MLFPGLKPGGPDKKVGYYFTKWWTNYQHIFGLAGFAARPSGGGLIAQQLIARLGGVEGARVFKIPGVRRLLKTYGPTDAFTRRAALQLIGGRDPNNPNARFSDY